MSARVVFHRRERGLSLVELLVAIAIGLILTTVVAQIFVSNKQAFSSTDDLSRMQENIRYSLGLLERTVRVAGYRSDFTKAASTVFPPVCPSPPVGTGQAVCATEGGGTASDSITVRFQGSGAPAADKTVVDCQGIELNANQIGVNRFYIANDTSINPSGVPSLYCDNQGSPGVTVSTPVVVVPDIDNMQILFGEDLATAKSVDRYVDAGSVTNWDKVIAVRIALLYRTANPTGGTGSPASVLLNGQTITPANDLRTRRVQTITIALRNRAQ